MSIPVSVGIASTWFGMHCGSGFATGSQYAIYYSKYGWLALITPIITWLVLAHCIHYRDRPLVPVCADYGGVRHPRWFRLSV